MVDSSKPSSDHTILTGTVSALLGNLLTAAVLYLVLAAGKAIPATIFLVSVAGLAVVGTLAAMSLWAIGSFSNNYTQSINGKKGVIIIPIGSIILAYL